MEGVVVGFMSGGMAIGTVSEGAIISFVNEERGSVEMKVVFTAFLLLSWIVAIGLGFRKRRIIFGIVVCVLAGCLGFMFGIGAGAMAGVLGVAALCCFDTRKRIPPLKDGLLSFDSTCPHCDEDILLMASKTQDTKMDFICPNCGEGIGFKRCIGGLKVPGALKFFVGYCLVDLFLRSVVIFGALAHPSSEGDTLIVEVLWYSGPIGQWAFFLDVVYLGLDILVLAFLVMGFGVWRFIGVGLMMLSSFVSLLVTWHSEGSFESVLMGGSIVQISFLSLIGIWLGGTRCRTWCTLKSWFGGGMFPESQKSVSICD